MSNPLVDFLSLTKKDSKTYTGLVIGLKGDRYKVKTSSGVVLNAWGSASIGTYVMVQDSKILGKIKKETTPVVTVR